MAAKSDSCATPTASAATARLAKVRVRCGLYAVAVYAAMTQA
jgi:hypothetical protein